jgi:lipoate-protein ligase B
LHRSGLGAVEALESRQLLAAQPVSRINPCGLRGLEVTDLRTLGVSLELRSVAELLAPHLLGSLGMHVDPCWT